MNKSKIVAVAVGVALAIVPVATVGEGVASSQKATITILTYAVGGPHRVSEKGPQPISNVAVRVISSNTGVVVRQIRESGGRVTVVVQPGGYRIEAKLAILPCTFAQVRVRKRGHLKVKIYCSIR